MAGASENSDSIYDVFAKSQRQLFDQWGKTLTAFQEAVQAGDPSEKFANNARQALKFYDFWKESVGKHLDLLLSACPGGAGTDTFARLFRVTDVYAKLYEFWEPLAKAVQERAFDTETYTDLLDPAKSREAIERIFGFGSPAGSSGAYGRAADLLETWGAKGQEFLRPWSDAMRKNLEASLAAAAGDSEAGMAAFRSLYSAFERTFGKALKAPAVGKDREQTELLSRTIDRYAVYLAKNAELQRRMHAIAQQAMQKVVDAMAQKVRDGEPISGFNEFVQLWTAINEKAFLDFFKTEEFSELQGLVLDTALDCRRQFQQLMEAALKDFPIALRSELEDVCRTNHTLNKSVRALRKKTAELDELRKELTDLKQRVAALEKQAAPGR
jgi:hypothetical protein